MKPIAWMLPILLSAPLLAQSQKDSATLEITERFLPKWSISLDLLNFYDNYPAALFGVEYTINNEFSVELEAGPTLKAEAYNDISFESYQGYKARLEGRLYFNEVETRNKRIFFAFDFTWKQDFYEDEYFIFYPNFTQLETGKFRRDIWGTHLRIGRVKFYSNDKFTFGWSIGIGREFYHIVKPSPSASSDFSESSPMDPFSINIRVKLGLVLKQYKDKPLFR